MEIQEVEQFLYREARMLDDRDFEGWLECYAPDAEFWMPAWDDDDTLSTDPQREISLIWYGNRGGLEDRVFRIRTERSSATSIPEPRTGHNITNVAKHPSPTGCSTQPNCQLAAPGAATGNSILLPGAPGCAGVADQAPRYQQSRKKEPDETRPDVDHIDQHGDGDPDAGQHGDRRRREAPGRPPRPGAQGPRGGGPGPGLGGGKSGGKICQEIPELTPGPRGQGAPRPLVELPGGQPARLEVLTQVRHDRITVGIGSLHLSRKIIPRHGVHRAPAFLTRTIVSGFRMY